MSQYSDYFDRQTPSLALHQKLLGLEPQRRHRRWAFSLAAGAACCLVALGLWLARSSGATPEQKVEAATMSTPQSTASSTPTSPPLHLPELQYSTGGNEIAAAIAFPDGHFQEDLTPGDSGPPLWRNRLVGGAGLDPLRPRRL